MSNEKYYDEVYQYLKINGETGVNELAKALNVPLSTMQRYLERQTYFRKTVSRKWVLPESVKTDIKANTLSLMVDSVENALLLIKSQLAEVQISLDNSLMPVNTLKRSVPTVIAPPVAIKSDKTTEMPERLVKMHESTAMMPRAIKEHKQNIPEEYIDILFNTDWLTLCIEMGTIYYQNVLGTEITSILTSNDDKLSEDLLIILEKYQKDK